MRELATFRTSALALTLFLLVTAHRAVAEEPAPAPTGHDYKPFVAVATPDASKAMTAFRKPEGWTLELFASEPMLANPVAFGFDETGRVYVVETFRLKKGVTDNRAHMSWLDDDLASRTVADRVAMYRKHLGKEAESYGVEHDRVRLIEDRDGDGKADHASVFADGFHDLASGLGAGVLARKGDVYFTCIPDLWRLRDTNGDGKADARTSLQTGYGVHVAFLGHDLHGLTFGPDGRLYFSIGDRGLNVKTADGRTVSCPDSGAVLRCEADGSDLQIFATGLRNPQELAFDEFGNLFTVDNNSDSGDKARIVHVVEGGDSGWRVGYQYLEKPISRGPWNAEKLWHPRPANTAAYLIPPVANLSDGPSGLVYNPGSTRLPDRYRHHFFLADFRGGAGGSGIRAFSLKPEGATFQLADSEQLLWGVLATDVDFGPDGALYLTDWVNGWDMTGKGRIYKLFDPTTSAQAADEVKTLLARGFDDRSDDVLIRLLAHDDQRVRQEAQFALAGRGAGALKPLRELAEGSTHRLARLHAIRALGQIARKKPALNPESLAPLVVLLNDPDTEVRVQTAITLGDSRHASATTPLIALLNDPSARVRSTAAIALGKLGTCSAVAPLLKVLRENADCDPVVRHSCVMGLTGINDLDALLAASSDSSASARLGVLLSLRRLNRPEIARFLNDADPTLATEAARAIHDAPIDAALPSLAALTDRPELTDPALRRVVQANARVGGVDSADRLARLARSVKLPDPIRVEAIETLASWPEPLGRDRITGLWCPAPGHPATEAAQALGSVLPELLESSEPVRLAALRALGPVPLPSAGPSLLAIVLNPTWKAETRTEALRALERLSDPRLAEAVKAAMTDPAPDLRVEGQRLLARLRPSDALPVLSQVLETGSLREQQGAFAVLGGMPASASDAILSQWLDRLKAGKIAPEVELDLLEAARRRNTPEIARRLGDLEASRGGDDPVSAYRETLRGGDATRGEALFKGKAELSCLRCHKVRGEGGEVGPDLTGIGTRHDRRYLLESIVAPNREIAKGFETLLVSTSDGQLKSGILKDSSGLSLRLITAEGKLVTIPKSEIEDQKRGASAMPDDLIKRLGKSDLRDLVEYLSTLK